MINEIRNRLAILSEDPSKLKDLVDNLIETDPQTASNLKVLLNSKIDDEILYLLDDLIYIYHFN